MDTPISTGSNMPGSRKRLVHANVGEVLTAELEKLDAAAGERLIMNEPAFLLHVAAGVRRYSSELPDYTQARAILGLDFVSADEIAAKRGTSYTEDQLIDLGKKLPEQATLEAVRDAGMILVAGPQVAMSLIDVRALNPDYFYSKGPDKDDEGWYDDASEKFARNDKVDALCWIALRKEPIENSLNKTWPDQQALVVEPMMVPNAAEAVWTLTTYKAVRDIYLLEDLYVRTSSLGSDGGRVYVGDFGAGGLYVGIYFDDGPDDDLGLASARKF